VTSRRIGRFELRAELARGSMGAVYRALDPWTGREVALKQIVFHGGDKAGEQLARFQTEAAAATRLDHPHVLAVHGLEVAGGLPWLVMDLAPGGTLSERLEREGPPPPREAARIGAALARALAHAHERGVLHRDVKPDNVLLDAAGEPLLTDFGLARLMDADAQLTAAGDVVGTPLYMAPEQAVGRRDRVGPATDVYGLGATLYHLLAGRPPFWSESVHEVLQGVVRRRPPPPSARRPGVPKDLERIVLRCLAKSPEERYPTAGALADALEGFLRPAKLPPRPGPAVGRGAAVATGAVALGLVAVGLAALVAFRDDGAAADPRPRAPEPTDGADAGGASANGGDPTRAEPAPSPAEAATEPEAPATPTAPPTPLSSPAEPATVEAALAEVGDLLEGLRPRAARDRAREVVARWPEAAAPRLALADTLVAGGRWDEALAAFDAAAARDPDAAAAVTAGGRRALEAFARLWPGPYAEEPLPGFTPAFGGSWRPEPDGVVVSDGIGVGTYQLSMALADEAPPLPLRIRVAVRLRPAGGDGPAYAGLVIGGRARGDFFALFLFVNPSEQASRSVPGGAEAYREEHGCWPTFLRLTRQRGPDWLFPATVLLPPQRDPWIELEVDLRGRRVQARVGGAVALDRELDRRLDGRVGLLKFFDHEVHFRGWSCTPLGG